MIGSVYGEALVVVLHMIGKLHAVGDRVMNSGMKIQLSAPRNKTANDADFMNNLARLDSHLKELEGMGYLKNAKMDG